MAKVLVRVNTDKKHPYDINDVVVVVEDNHTFGVSEMDSNMFRVVQITGKTAKELEYLMDAYYRTPIEYMPKAYMKQPKLLINYLLKKSNKYEWKIKAERRYKIDLNSEIIDKRMGNNVSSID